jgi:uncharacterized membrane protein (DUF485 family)
MDIHVLAQVFREIGVGQWLSTIAFVVIFAVLEARRKAFERIMAVLGYLLFSLVVGFMTLLETGLFAKLNSAHSIGVDLLAIAVALGALVLPYVIWTVTAHLFSDWRRDRRIRAAINNAVL